MEVNLIIRATKYEDDVNVIGKQYSFIDASKITIGRGKPNDIPLADSGRTVSRNHAQLIASSEGYVFKDLGSKNFSFVNNEKVLLNSTRLLESGDMIRVGEFEIEYVVSESAQDPELTVVDPLGVKDFSVNNPFSDAVHQMVQSWGKLITQYDASDVGDKPEYVVHALKEELSSIENHEVMSLFLTLVSNEQKTEETYVPAVPAVPIEKTLEEAGSTVSTQPSPSLHLNTALSSRVLDTSLELLKDLIRIPYEFRGEFIGHTMWQDEESTFLYEGDYEATKRYLLEDATESEVKRKLQRLKKACEKVKVHQVGMMEGYKAIVKESLEKILTEIDPANLDPDEIEKGILHKTFPMLASQKILEALEKKIESFKGADWGAIEQRIYRPMFIRAYMTFTGKEE